MVYSEISKRLHSVNIILIFKYSVELCALVCNVSLRSFSIDTAYNFTGLDVLV